MKQKKKRLIGWILFIILVSLLVVSNKVASKDIQNLQGKHSTIESKQYVMEQAKCFLCGETACLAVYEKSGIDSEVTFYQFLNDEEIQIATPNYITDVTKTINADIVRIKIADIDGGTKEAVLRRV